MGAFPLLKSGAIVQYPVTRTLEYSTRVLRFVDGTEQRFRQYGSGLHKWLVRLDLLDEEELLRLEQFFTSEQGRFGSFAFTDPWSGAEYANCSLESDTLDLNFQDAAMGSTALVIRENRI